MTEQAPRSVPEAVPFRVVTADGDTIELSRHLIRRGIRVIEVPADYRGASA